VGVSVRLTYRLGFAQMATTPLKLENPQSMKFLAVTNAGPQILAIFCLSITLASARPRPPLPPAPEPGVVAAWRFNDSAETKSLRVVNANTVESWSGYALQMSGDPSAICAVPHLARNGRTNINLTGSATLRFWFSPAWTSASAGGKGAGNPATLLEAGSWSDTTAHPQWSLIVNAEGTAIHLVVHNTRGPIGLLEVPVVWRAGEWHQVALS
jgi:hypothetical protein